MKFLCPAHGAQIRQIDARRYYSRCGQLLPIGPGQIDMRSSLPRELDCDLRPDFIAALSDAWSDGRMQILRDCAKALVHSIDSLRRDLCYGPAPSRMDRRDRAPALIHQ